MIYNIVKVSDVMKKNIFRTLNIISIVVFLIVFLTKEYNTNRMILAILGVIISTFGFIYNSNKRSIIKTFLYMLVWFIGLYMIDIGGVYFLSRKPVFAFEYKSSDKFITYNSLFYREFSCDNKIYIDPLYRKSDYCSYKLLEEKDINTLSSDIVNNYDNYKNKFYLIDAKISNKEGNNKIELKSFNEESNINGNVTFNDNIIYKVYFNNIDGIDDTKIYDNVKIVGRITNLKKGNDTYKITIKEAYLVKTKKYDNFSINVVENKSCDKDKTNYVKTDEYNYYTSCLNKIYVLYEDEVYDLDYVLKDERISLDDLLKDYKSKEKKEMKDTVEVLYTFDDYNIIVHDKNVIIGNKKLSLDSNYFAVSDVDLNEL